jgi:orotidine-5'-phosphate decarboxylase
VHAADRLAERIRQTSPVCVGLDPQLGKLPEGVAKDPAGVRTFCEGIVEATADIASCVKLNLAFFEVLGWEGMKVFWEVSRHARDRGMFVIADGKRGDIGSTCEAYADAYLYDESPVDALTVNPYLGSDGITPFLERSTKNEKGIFVLVKTSNESSGELQDLPVGDEVVHEHVAQLTESWGMHHIGPHSSLSCVGAVVGATYPEEVKYLRTLMPHIPFLIPGYGAQGGSADDVKHGFIPDGTGAIVSASRSILYASSGSDWQQAARKAAGGMKVEIARVLAKG